MSDGKRFLIAVNAGSNQISVLRINKNTLELADIVDSGGSRPISAALHDDLLYVLNEGGTPNIAGFTFNEMRWNSEIITEFHSTTGWRRER
jgi:6-phosphogluconolactonase